MNSDIGATLRKRGSSRAGRVEVLLTTPYSGVISHPPPKILREAEKTKTRKKRQWRKTFFVCSCVVVDVLSKSPSIYFTYD